MADGVTKPSSVGPGGNGPTITANAAPQLIVSGRGFLPGCAIIIRVISQDGNTAYFQYAADSSGDLVAALPTSIPHGRLLISATDNRPDPDDQTGVRWADTATVTW